MSSTLRGLLNKYAEDKNRYHNLHRMMDSRTYPITRTRGDKEVQDKTEGGTKQNDNLQKTETKGAKIKDKTEDGENKDHTRVCDKTHTGKITKDHAKVQTKTHTGNLNKDLNEAFTKIRGQDTEGIGGSYSYLQKTETKGDKSKDKTITEDLAKVLAKTHTGMLTKNLTGKHVTENEAVTNSDNKVETGKGVTLKLSKSMICKPEVKGFGRIFSGAGVSADPSKQASPRRSRTSAPGYRQRPTTPSTASTTRRTNHTRR